MSENSFDIFFKQLNTDFYSALLNNIHDGIYFIDKNLVITFWNNGAERITGFKNKEVLGKQCSDNILSHVDSYGTELCNDLCPFKKALIDGQVHTCEAYLRHKEGFRLPVIFRVLPCLNKKNIPIGAVQTFSDVSPKVMMPQKTRELKHMSLLDPITEVGNRRYLEMHLLSRIEEMHNYHLPFGIMYIDIDHLNNINEAHGNKVGNQVLRTVAQTISNNIRFFDVVGRWGEDEFIVTILNISEPKLDMVANKLRLLILQSNIFTDPTSVKTSTSISITVSIGATIAKSTDTLDRLINRGEALMNHSRWRGRNRASLSFEKEFEEF